MYLAAYVFLMISLLGLYTQIYSIQAMNFLSNQKVLGQTLLAWHNAAVTLSKNNAAAVATKNAAAPNYCHLDSITGNSPICGATIKMEDPTAPANTSTLPPGYNFTAYQWNTIAYKNGSKNYVITYVPPPASGNLVDQPDIGISVGELMRQLKASKTSTAAYGAVGTVGTSRVLLSSMENYQLVLPGDIATGSIAVVSQY